ncbi:MAG: hypothetical protein EXS64_13150 [Candidatus Latescibacteria bacterium]|nr:hypothetical protein [Candidatus Latescibacterota bacterium]
MDMIEVPTDLDREAFSRKAIAIYEQKYRTQLEASERGKVIAIEVESSKTFLGRTALEAAMKARIVRSIGTGILIVVDREK